MNFNDTLVLINTYGNAIVVLIAISINFWLVVYSIINFKKRRELRIKRSEENFTQQLQDKIKFLEKRLEDEKELTVNFWIEKSKKIFRRMVSLKNTICKYYKKLDRIF